MKKSKKILISVLSSILGVLVIAVVGILIYMSDEYEAVGTGEYLASSEDVTVTSTQDYIEFKSNSDGGDVIIFYQGAKVDESAYSRMMYKLAEGGVTCLVLRCTLNFAFFNSNDALDYLDMYGGKNIYLMGHSLGGVVASSVIEENSDRFKGIIYLASYMSNDLSELDIKALSIYGDMDGVLNKESYNDSVDKRPTDFTEYVISGGNHANFAEYGMQKGDNEAQISNEEQIRLTVGYILDFIK